MPALRENARLGKNIEVIEAAVSSQVGISDFFMGNNSSVGSLQNVGGPALRVPVTTVDTFVADHAGIDVGLVKTDIEGHDLEALCGMNATVTRFQPLILTECEYSAVLADLCSGWKYKLFSNVRDRRTQRTHFCEIHQEDAGLHWAKMLFLVPEALQPAFASLVEN